MSSALDLGSFEELETRYSCVFPVGDEPDPVVVSAIRRICPNYVPMWVAREYKTPSQTIHVAKYHVIGTWQQRVTDDKTRPVRAERPYDFPFHGGVLYAHRPWCVTWPENTWQHRVNFPPQGLPYDWDVYWFVRQVYMELHIPFGTLAEGNMGAAGRQFNANRSEAQELEQKTLADVQENSRLELRDRVSNSPTAAKAYEDWLDGIVNNKPEKLFKEVDAKPFRDQIKSPEPPVAA